ncbi:MAG TPA: 4Fe-4S dicluster domain-containing protein [Nitrospinota bacterium]|nr:4Fe-4S dicluster domain-containing protein [Nitrospinota bacterium]
MSECIKYDVVLVGAGPANLTLAYRLLQLAKKPIKIAIFEKGKAVGSHLLSGAVSNPRVISKLFPNWMNSDFPLQGIVQESNLSLVSARRWENLPSFATPPYFKKEGYAILNLSDLATYMVRQIKELEQGKDGAIVDVFPGFAATSIIYDGNRVIGVRVDDTGDDESDICYGNVISFGDKGFLSREIVTKFNLSNNPQIYSVGVKEVWETNESYEGKVWHTIGYPMEPGHFGGGFIYGCKNNKLAIGMVLSCAFQNPNIEPPQILQELKKHHYVQDMIRGGKLIKYGAAILPEGGYYSMPEKFAVDGAILLGDACGTLDVKRFSGVDKAMESGYQAAESVLKALEDGDFSGTALGLFQENLMNGWVGQEIRNSRYFRQAFVDYPELNKKVIPGIIDSINAGKAPWYAVMKMGIKDPFGSLELLNAKKMIENPSDKGPVVYEEDRLSVSKGFKKAEKESPVGFDHSLLYSTADVVFYANTHYEEDNNHIDELDANVCANCIKEYDAAGYKTPCVGDCTADVHQTLDNGDYRYHSMALENCVQCRTCEIVCPNSNLRVNAAMHGYGPDFSGM